MSRLNKYIDYIFGIKHIPNPTVQARQKTVNLDTTKNVQYLTDQNIAFEVVETENGFESVRIGSGILSESNPTNRDQEICQTRKLDFDKYMTLKPFWQAGQSAAIVAKKHKGQRGYGKRTLESYLSAYNAAKDPQKTAKTT